MTPREHIATEALNAIITGLITNPDGIGWTVQGNCVAAVQYADALLAELEKKPCTCGEPTISDRIEHRYDGTPCFVKP